MALGDTLQQMVAAVQKLNAITDQENQALLNFQQQLVTLNFGWMFVSKIELEEDDQGTKYMGFAKVDGQWCLTYHVMKQNETTHITMSEGIPILKASRRIRLIAGASIEPFAEAMLNYMNHLNERIAARNMPGIHEQRKIDTSIRDE